MRPPYGRLAAVSTAPGHSPCLVRRSAVRRPRRPAVSAVDRSMSLVESPPSGCQIHRKPLSNPGYDAGMTEDEFAAVDALVEEARRHAAMPGPAERRRLRIAAGLSRAQVAQAVGTTRQTVANWETGDTAPRPPARERYLRLLEGLQALYPPPESPPEQPDGGPTEGPSGTPGAPEAVVEPDRGPDGALVRGELAACVLCGRPTPYRAAGRPQHIKAMCISPLATTAPTGTTAATPTAAPPQPAPRPESAPSPRRVPGRRRETSGFVAGKVAAALEEHGGDVEAATAALIRRAIPDVMELLESTRVGGRYDYSVYPEMPDILMKTSRDGADQIWEGRPKWRSPTVELRRGPVRAVTALDINGAYLSALKTHLPIGRLVHSDGREFDRRRSGVYLITPPEWPHEDLPNPLGAREEAGPLWVTDATLRLLLRLSGPKYGLCAPPVIHESWTSGASEGLLERLRRELAAAREAAIEAGDTVTVEYVKAMYSKFVSTIGQSTANRNIRRQDWMHIIRSQAFANLWLKGWKAHQAGLTLVRMMGTDELHVIGDWRRVFPEGRKLTEVKVKSEYDIGGGV